MKGERRSKKARSPMIDVKSNARHCYPDFLPVAIVGVSLLPIHKKILLSVH